MAQKVKAAQEAAFGSSNPSPARSPPQPQEQLEEMIPSTPQELTGEKELPFVNQPEKLTPLFPKITIIELPWEKRKIKAPEPKRTPEVIEQNIFLGQPDILFILEELEMPVPIPSISSSDKSYDIIELESGDLELHEVQKLSQVPSPTMEADKETVEEVVEMATQVGEITAINMDVQETIKQTQGSLQAVQQEKEIEAKKSPPRDTLKGKERRAEELHSVEIFIDELQEGRKGLDRAALEALPTFVYSSKLDSTHASQQQQGGSGLPEMEHGKSSSKPMAECPVCLSEFQEAERGRLLPNCKHRFHVECIDTWLLANGTCPVCRASCAAEAPAVGAVAVQFPTNVLFWGSNNVSVLAVSSAGAAPIHITTTLQPLQIPAVDATTASSTEPASSSRLNPLRRLLSRDRFPTAPAPAPSSKV
ncbi:hypothetical protein L7F22_023065 [Adiantum nelumboides]|nr:hypothetical protein [Adiantum nelumboides]